MLKPQRQWRKKTSCRRLEPSSVLVQVVACEATKGFTWTWRDYGKTSIMDAEGLSHLI